MGITIDKARAKRRLAEAVAWAHSDRPVPGDWTALTWEMERAPSATFTPALATGLLARATDNRLDALAIKEAYADNAYSMRTLCHSVLVPGAVEDGFGLRSTGREPLNNQPFFRYDHVLEIDRLQSRARPSFALLKGGLTVANGLDEDEALGALAAFLRVRFEVAAAVVPFTFASGTLGLADLTTAVEAFLADDVDRPKRVQALVAATFNLVYDDVLTRRINDPSRNFPGDVQGLLHDVPVMGAEARGKPVPETEVQAFAAALRRSGIGRGFLVALHTDHQPLDRASLSEWSWREHAVVMQVVETVDELVRKVVAWSTDSVESALERLPRLIAERLEEIEATTESRARWAALAEG